MPQKKIIKGTVAKLQGTDVFHLEPAERSTEGGGWREMDGRGRKAETQRQEGRSRVGRQEDEKSGEIGMEGERSC